MRLNGGLNHLLLPNNSSSGSVTAVDQFIYLTF